LCTMRVNQVRTDPRRGSYCSACLQARSKACWAMSSARPLSPTMVSATPNTMGWNRRTKALAAGASPAPRPASSMSSGILAMGVRRMDTSSITDLPRLGLSPGSDPCAEVGVRVRKRSLQRPGLTFMTSLGIALFGSALEFHELGFPTTGRVVPRRCLSSEMSRRRVLRPDPW
jgi:hypothetical protein